MERLYSFDRVIRDLEYCLQHKDNCKECTYYDNLNCIGKLQKEALYSLKLADNFIKNKERKEK